MRMNIRVTFLLATFMLFVTACVSAPMSQGQPGEATAIAGTPLSTTARAEPASTDVKLLDLATIKRMWGRTWMVNPFLPWEKSFSGIQFQVYAVGIQSHANVIAVINEPEAFLADGSKVGRSYEKNDYLDFWLDRTDEDVEGWERKKTTIERTVPYLNSEVPLYANKVYVIPLILPKDSKIPAKIMVSMLINGNPTMFEVLP